MKFIVSSNALVKQLQALSGVVVQNNALPILEDFLFEINPGELTAWATDLETTIVSRIPIEAKESARLAIPAKILIDALKSFADQPLTFNVDEKNKMVEISSDYGKYKISSHPAEDFPNIPVVSGTTSLEIPSRILSDAISKTIFATAVDDMRPVMTGVYFQLSPENVTFVATDAHKLVRYRRTDARSDKNVSFIVPKKPLNILKNILPSDDVMVKIDYNESNAYFSFENYNVICRLIEGRYPNYEAVIPKDNPNKMIIDRDAFLSSIKRVSIFSSKATQQIKFMIKGSEINVSAEDMEYANAANERLSCQYEGRDIEIGFNARFIMDMLMNLQTEEVAMEMSEPNRAGLLLPSDSKDKQEDLLMLVMPVMVN